MKQLIVIAVLLALGACTNSDAAYRALDGAGYTKVTLTGWAPFTCDKHDTFATGFEAVGPTGKHVRGTVCSGFLKGATIRLD